MSFWRKFAVAMLLAVIVYNYAGYYGVCLVIRFHIQEEMEEQILKNAPEELLEEIVYTGNEDLIHWKKKGKEFLLRGQMYDVVRVKKVKGKTVLLCINDKKEEKLVKQLSEVVQSHTHSTNKAARRGVVKISFEPAIITVPDFSLVVGFSRVRFFNHDMRILNRFDTIISPPPKRSPVYYRV